MRPWAQWAWLLGALAVVNLKLLRSDFLPVHDTLAHYQAFHLDYNEYFMYREFPRWLPLSAGGLQSDTWQNSLGPCQVFCIFLGALLRVRNSLWAFYASVILEQIIFLGGLRLLARRLYRRDESRLFVCLAAAGTIFWEIQNLGNFETVVFLPFSIYFLVRFFEEGPCVFLWASLLALAQAWLTSYVYSPPILGLAFCVVSVGMACFGDREAILRRGKPLSAASLLLLGALLAVGGIYAKDASQSAFFSVCYVEGRDPKAATVPLGTFLTYGSPKPAQMLELLYAVPADETVTLFIGLIPLVFLGTGLLGPLRPMAKALWAASLVLALFSWSYLTVVAPALYYVFPLMRYFRHVHFVLPILRVFLILLAGFGLDCWLSEAEGSSRFASALADLRFQLVAFGLAALILALDVFAFREGGPYPIRFTFRGNFPPEILHLIPLLLLVLLILAVRRTPRRRGLAVLSFFALEMLAYQTWLSLSSPAWAAGLPNGIFEVAPPRYSPARADVAAFKSGRGDSLLEKSMASRSGQPNAAAARILLGLWGVKFNIIDSFLGIDHCGLDEKVEFVNSGIDRLARARLGLLPLSRTDFEDPSLERIQDLGPLRAAMEVDPAFRRSFGCGAPKMRLLTRVAKGGDPELEALKIRNNPEIDQSAYLNGAAEAMPDYLAGSRSPPCRGAVEVTNFRSNAVTAVADVSTETGCWLVYSDAYHPGWSASVNGLPRPVAEANFAYKAVKVERGHSVVEFKFDGPNALWGRLVAAWRGVSCLLALAYVGFA